MKSYFGYSKTKTAFEQLVYKSCENVTSHSIKIPLKNIYPEMGLSATKT